MNSPPLAVLAHELRSPVAALAAIAGAYAEADDTMRIRLRALARDAAGRLEIFAGLRDFREHLGGELCVTFPQGIGARFEMHEIDLPLMEGCLKGLKPA